MGLEKELLELDVFVIEMKRKLIDVEYKHPENIEQCSLSELKLHLIDEFSEVFNLDSIDRKIIKDFFINKEIDYNELKDLANMCFALNLYNIKVNKI